MLASQVSSPWTPFFFSAASPDTHINLSSDSRRTKTSRRRWIFAISSSISSGIMVVSAMETMSSWPVWETWNAGVKALSVHWFPRIPSFQKPDSTQRPSHTQRHSDLSFHCTCVFSRRPFGNWETHFSVGTLLWWHMEAQVGSPKPAHDCVCGLDSPWLFPAPESLLPQTMATLPGPSPQDQVQL